MRYLMAAMTVLLAISAPVFADDKCGVLGEYEIRFYESGVEYHLYKDVPYLGDKRDERLDVYSPVSTISHPRPAVLIIHGGGWATGSRSGQRELDFVRFAVEQGYVAVSISYKLTEYEGKPWSSKKIKGGWPQNIYDCKSALRFMKTGIVNIDPLRIAVMGGSAGGHMAMLTGLSAQSQELNKGGLYTDKSNDVRCIINFYGIPDVRRWGGDAFIDVSRQEHPEVWALASPVEHISKKMPPILIIHGTADETVKIGLSEEFVAILKEKELPHKYIVVEDAPHSFGLKMEKMDLRPIVGQFLKENFNGKDDVVLY